MSGASRIAKGLTVGDIDIPAPARLAGLAPAQRGAQVQLIAPPPPRQTWDPGDFVQNVIGFAGQKMAFSFDDGPSPSNTYTVLQALAARNVKATFFLVGVNVLAYPQIARDIVSEGHELGNHSIYHSPYRASALADQIAGNQDIIQAATGVRPVVHRAPGLTRGSAILYTLQQKVMYEMHTHMSTSDYLSPRWSASSLINQFSRNLRNGSVPIYHDGGGRRPTRDAVASMLDIALARGYTCSTATELVNSGVPVPGIQGYPQYLGLELPADEHSHDDGSMVDCCQFDPRAAFLERLDDPTVKAAERSRIVELLAMLDEQNPTD
jgi:peptidoglycan/xylan/chitin deacetylase (PgdA/CDA1 family)